MLECVAVNLTLVYSVLAYLRTKNTELHTLLVSCVIKAILITVSIFHVLDPLRAEEKRNESENSNIDVHNSMVRI